MISHRQLEALHWIVELGSFKNAASRLNTTQSAVSKRIQELESALDLAVFDRSQRSAKLTKKGEHVAMLGREVLALLDRIERLRSSGEVPVHRLRIGVTELTAMTWLSRFITAIRAQYPNVVIEPDVAAARHLYDRLHGHDLDLIFVPEAFPDAEISSIRVGKVVNAWMAKPGIVDTGRILTLEELTRYPILCPGGNSGFGLFLNRWFRSKGVVLGKPLSNDSLTALVGLTVAGVGIGHLPWRCYRSLMNENKLVLVRTKPALSPVPYVAMFRNESASSFMNAVCLIARNSCDFIHLFNAKATHAPTRRRTGHDDTESTL
ncbi:LysR family transcriptional regulator [Rhodovulum sp. PH10]|uniref:LysR family transcriptional regulator n=1 Tax=Rhodovulum sp. PH10 TaxID=1187851 RepID=UPI000A03482E|nr:LysR family transcriptional regulator [Rhodovulum sp. PH10]